MPEIRHFSSRFVSQQSCVMVAGLAGFYDHGTGVFYLESVKVGVFQGDPSGNEVL